MEFLSISWKRLHEDTHALAKKIKASEKKFDLIVAIARGGMTIAQILSDFLSLPIATFTISSYEDLSQKKLPTVFYHFGSDIKNKHILLVDDISDTGKTFKHGINYLKDLGVLSIKTVSPFIKPHSAHVPDFFIEKTAAWVVFPYEVKETILSVSAVMKKENKTREEITKKLRSLEIDEKYIQIYLK